MDIRDEYFHWLVSLVCNETMAKQYDILLKYLHKTEFTWILEMDENRAVDGIDMRSEFAYKNDIPYQKIRNKLYGPCSVLEMMVGLSYRCENSIMGDDEYGDRTGEWFYTMIKSLNLDEFKNHKYDEYAVEEIVSCALSREFSKNGYGGWFYIPNLPKDKEQDLTKVDIWYQMNWWLVYVYERR